MRERYDHPGLRISMVVPTFYRRTRLAHEILASVCRTRFPKEIAHSVVGYHVRIDEAQSRGLSIFEYAPRDRGAKVMAELAEELEQRGRAAARWRRRRERARVDPRARAGRRRRCWPIRRPAEDGPALGSDPFAEPGGPDPLAARLDAARARPRRARGRARGGGARRWPRSAASRAGAAALRARAPVQRRAPVLPTLGEIELPEPQGLIDRFLGEDARRVLAAFSHLVEAEGPYDRFGFSPDVTRRAFPFFHALYRGWFRVQSEGHAHLPESGPAVLVSNHAGLLPFDARHDRGRRARCTAIRRGWRARSSTAGPARCRGSTCSTRASAR